MYTDNEREAFFIEVYKKYYTKMENICRAYVQYNEEYRSLIDESIQETYLTAVKDYQKLKTHPALEGWFMETCFHRFSTALAKYRRRQAHHQVSINDDKAFLQVADTVNNLDTWWQNESNAKQIQRILDVLSEREVRVYHEYFESEKASLRLPHHKTLPKARLNPSLHVYEERHTRSKCRFISYYSIFFVPRTLYK